MNFAQHENYTRDSFILKNTSLDKLRAIAKEFRLTKGDVMDVLIENADTAALKDIFAQCRIDKIHERAKNRVTQRDIYAELRGLTPEQLAKIKEAINEQKAG